MRDKVENLTLFIAEHKAYFLARIASDVSFDWEDDSWSTDNTHKGVFLEAVQAAWSLRIYTVLGRESILTVRKKLM